MPLAFTSSPATVGEASRPLAAPFWAGSAPRTPTKSDADADAAAPRPLTLTFVEGEDREKHAAPPPPSPLNAVLAFGGWRTVRPEPLRLVRMPAPPQTYYGRRRCVLAAALAFVLCGAAPARLLNPGRVDEVRSSSDRRGKNGSGARPIRHVAVVFRPEPGRRGGARPRPRAALRSTGTTLDVSMELKSSAVASQRELKSHPDSAAAVKSPKTSSLGLDDLCAVARSSR